MENIGSIVCGECEPMRVALPHAGAMWVQMSKTEKHRHSRYFSVLVTRTGNRPPRFARGKMRGGIP